MAAPRATHLVYVDAQGGRVSNLTAPLFQGQIDREPAWRPDGTMIAFASNRNNAPRGSYGLWISTTRDGAVPRQLLSPMRGLRDLTWAPDGRSLLFSAKVKGVNQVFRLPLVRDNIGRLVAAGAARALTSGPQDRVMPNESARGQLAWVAVDQKAGTTQLEVDGKPHAPPGSKPINVSYPAWSPDGKRLAYSVLLQRDKRVDVDIVVTRADGKILFEIAEPLADQTGPVWSRDGHALFCTSTFRATKTGVPLISSLTVIDLQAEAPRWRALHGSGDVLPRRWPAVNPRVRWNGKQIASLPPYKEALRQAVLQRIAQELNERRRLELEKKRRDKPRSPREDD